MLALNVTNVLQLGGDATKDPAPETWVHDDIGFVEDAAFKTSVAILSVINRYKLGHDKSTAPSLPAQTSRYLGFLPLIYQSVTSRTPVRMCLPAFPFKSPNNVDKVLGRLPDKAEEIALAHLNGMCLAIADVYEHGAKLLIVSDGLVYNDLLGVPDRHVWAYGEALRALSVEKEFGNIEFSRLQDLVHMDMLPSRQLDEITYVANATNFRRALLNTFGNSDWDPDHEIPNNEDACLTYRGYIKFLRTDLRYTYLIGHDRSRAKFKSGTEYIAKQMLQRGAAFSNAIQTKFGGTHVRLSIHRSTSGNKIPISTLPTTGPFTTPWHCSVALDINGDVHSAHRATFDSNSKYDLINDEHGRPSYYREKSPLWTWTNNPPITFTPLYPCGLLIRPSTPHKLSIDSLDAPKIRALAELNSPIILRGFSQTTDHDLYLQKAHELGVPQPWKWGLVYEVKDVGADPVKNASNTFALSAEWMPFHYDGVFKTVTETLPDGTALLKPDPPRFQFFVMITPSPKNTGYTLFTPSRLLLRNLNAPLSSPTSPETTTTTTTSTASNRTPPQTLDLATLRTLTYKISTTAFSMPTMPTSDTTTTPTLTKMPLISPHPTTNAPCLRYHEPWPSSKTAFAPIHVQIEDVTDEESERICEALNEALKDRRNCYWHSWEKGDLLVADNVGGLHTRTDFKAEAGAEGRELWRVHFN